MFRRSIPYVAHKRLVTGTRLTTSSPRVITRVIRSVTPFRSVRSVTPFRYSTPIRSVTPLPDITSLSLRYPITPISLLSDPIRTIHSYTTPISNSPFRSNFGVRPSVYNREYDRIMNKPRFYPEHSYTESFLNSSPVRVSFCSIGPLRLMTIPLLCVLCK